jgi:hypothetical protein
MDVVRWIIVYLLLKYKRLDILEHDATNRTLVTNLKYSQAVPFLEPRKKAQQSKISKKEKVEVTGPIPTRREEVKPHITTTDPDEGVSQSLSEIFVSPLANTSNYSTEELDTKFFDRIGRMPHDILAIDEKTGARKTAIETFYIKYIVPSISKEASKGRKDIRNRLRDNFYHFTQGQLKLLVFQAPWVSDLFETVTVQTRVATLIEKEKDLLKKDRWRYIVVEKAKPPPKYEIIPSLREVLDTEIKTKFGGTNSPTAAQLKSFLFFVFTHGVTYIPPEEKKKD